MWDQMTGLCHLGLASARAAGTQVRGSSVTWRTYDLLAWEPERSD